MTSLDLDAVTGELVPVRRDTVIAPLNTEQVKAAMTGYQEGLKSILDDTDYQEFRDKKSGDTRRFPKRSAWRKIAYWFNLDLDIISKEVVRDEQGNPLRASVVARATHPNGRHADGDGGCSVRERGFSKPEHDIPATAATRAMNRAISNLVGMGQVSAEEVDEVEHTYGPPATNKQVGDALRAATLLYGDDAHAGTLMLRLEQDAGDYLPKIVARAVMFMAAHRPGQQEDHAETTETGAGTEVESEDTQPPDGPTETADTNGQVEGETAPAPDQPAQ